MDSITSIVVYGLLEQEAGIVKHANIFYLCRFVKSYVWSNGVKTLYRANKKVDLIFLESSDIIYKTALIGLFFAKQEKLWISYISSCTFSCRVRIQIRLRKP